MNLPSQQFCVDYVIEHCGIKFFALHALAALICLCRVSIVTHMHTYRIITIRPYAYVYLHESVNGEVCVMSWRLMHENGH